MALFHDVNRIRRHLYETQRRVQSQHVIESPFLLLIELVFVMTADQSACRQIFLFWRALYCYNSRLYLLILIVHASKVWRVYAAENCLKRHANVNRCDAFTEWKRLLLHVWTLDNLLFQSNSATIYPFFKCVNVTLLYTIGYCSRDSAIVLELGGF